MATLAFQERLRRVVEKPTARKYSPRVGGTIEVSLNGRIQLAKGEWTYSLGGISRKSVLGIGGQFEGYVETPVPGYIEGEITDRSDMALDDLVKMTNASVYLTLANDKVIVLHRAFFAGEAVGHTDEGNISVRFEGIAHEVRNTAAAYQPDAGD